MVKPRIVSSGATRAFRKPRVFYDGLRPQDSGGRDLKESVSEASRRGFTLADAHFGELWFEEQAVGHQSIGGDAAAAKNLSTQDALIVVADMRELRTSRHDTYSPNT